MTSVFERPAFRRARRLCLALPETTERQSWGHPSFRAGKKTFCTFEMIGGRPSIAFRLDPAAVKRALRRPRFFETPYGRGVWVSVSVEDRIEWRLVEAMIEQAYRSVATKSLCRLLDGRRRRVAR